MLEVSPSNRRLVLGLAPLRHRRRSPRLIPPAAAVLAEPVDDGSVDILFGPEPPAEHRENWIQTVPRKGFWLILRLYGPLEPWFDKTWRPGEIELVK